MKTASASNIVEFLHRASMGPAKSIKFIWRQRMKQYHDHLHKLIQDGVRKEDRTGTGTLSLFGHQMRFDLRREFPLLTTKKTHFKSIVHELLWFLNGDTNIEYLKKNGVSIWDEWASEDGELGPVYGAQWRRWTAFDRDFEEGPGYIEIDQLRNAIEALRRAPDDRGIIVSAWNVGELDQMALRPCHTMFQFYTRPMDRRQRLDYALRVMSKDGRITGDAVAEYSTLEAFDAIDAWLEEQSVPTRYLSCQLYQRSADWFLGVPFNIASYSLLTMMVAQVVNMAPYEFVHSFGDTHLYLNHINQAKELLNRVRRAPGLPTVTLAPRGQDIDEFEFDDFQLEGYDPLPAIKAPVAV